MPAGSVVPRRGVVGLLTLCLVAVLGLDATAIVAAPAQLTSGSHPATPLPPTQLRMLTWSGMTWLVDPVGTMSPGKGPQSDSTKAAHVDAAGHLHLKIIKKKGKWRSVTLESLTPPSYGRYRFTVAGSTAAFMRNVVLGLFLYKAGAVRFTHELDIEDSYSLTGIKPPNNAQFIVQPYTHAHHSAHYQVGRSIKKMTQTIDWGPQQATFTTRTFSGGSSHLVRRFHFSGSDVPSPVGEHLYVNMWLVFNHPPKGSGTHQIVLDSVTHS